ISSAAITDSTQKIAINNLVIQLKDSSLWEKFKAIYPMVGGSASGMKWNLKDPENTDNAYRLTFYGSPVFSSTGVLFPTVNDFADTHLADTSLGGYNNASMSYYSRTQNTISGYDMGCTDGAVPYNELSISFVDGDDSEWFGFSEDGILTPNTTGLFMFSSTTTNVKRFRNGVVKDAKGSAGNESYTNLTILIGKSRVTVHPGQRECALASLGNGLSDAQALTFYNIVQNFENKLNR
ncbi:MAG: hypothetical protein M3139_15995, partial [Bacteroidota bacterium]|nr:hypothetical protein [Bacteroidota bacterium]